MELLSFNIRVSRSLWNKYRATVPHSKLNSKNQLENWSINKDLNMLIEQAAEERENGK